VELSYYSFMISMPRAPTMLIPLLAHIVLMGSTVAEDGGGSPKYVYLKDPMSMRTTGGLSGYSALLKRLEGESARTPTHTHTHTHTTTPTVRTYFWFIQHNDLNDPGTKETPSRWQSPKYLLFSSRYVAS
jgi:hypothetical protein